MATPTPVRITTYPVTFTGSTLPKLHEVYVPKVSMPAGFVAKWDLSDSTAADGTAISSMPELVGGFAGAFTQANTAYQPTLVTRGKNKFAHGTGTNMWLTTTGARALPVFTVAMLLASENNGYAFGSNPGPAVLRNVAGAYGMGAGKLVMGGSPTGVVAIVATFNGASSAVNVNGIEATGDAGTTALPTSFTLLSGATSYFTKGDAGYVHLWDRALSQAERSQAVQHLIEMRDRT